MNYLSTRGGMPPARFTEILLGGLATMAFRTGEQSVSPAR